MNEVDKVRISKRFSMILRHTASETPGLEIRPDGFVALRSILAIPVFAKNRVTVDFVKTMVAKDEKTRFSLIEESGELFIRANQGHSTKVAELLNTDEVLTEIRAAGEIPKAVHGTDKQAWDRFIKHEGLKPMKRAFIHFAPGVLGEDDVRSGMRKSSSVYIYIDTAKAMRDGIKFYRSENNVILSTGLNGVISPAYFAKVEDVRTGGVLFTNTGT
jgi:2'-phosphotransferase